MLPAGGTRAATEMRRNSARPPLAALQSDYITSADTRKGSMSPIDAVDGSLCVTENVIRMV